MLARVRREQAEWLGQLRAVEQRLSEATARAGTSQDEIEALRARQGAIGEKLSQLQLATRKLHAVTGQSQMAADYLAGQFGDADSDLLSLTQVWALEAQEEERRRLAREIHDGPAQVLANATFQLEFCQRLIERDPGRLKGEMERVKADLREGLAEVRYFIFDLRPGPLAQLGLPATLQKYAEDFQARSGIQISTDIEYEHVRLSPTKEVAIFRIVQEALQNVRKHSGARSARVTLSRIDGATEVQIVDDGVGFDSAATAESGARRFGLASMAERARLIGAELRVTSSPGSGTQIDLRVPAERGSGEN